MDAGRLDRRLQFQSPYEIEDGAGNYSQGWQPEFELAANTRFLRGGEQVLASRLEQKTPLIVTVRACVAARRITGDWRAVDMRNGAIYHIKETPRLPVDKSGREVRAFFEMLAMAGVEA